MRVNLLVGTTLLTKEEVGQLSKFADVRIIEKLTDEELDDILPSVESMLINMWPKQLDATRISEMRKLRFIQVGLAGVDHVPFRGLPKEVQISSNAGGYSDEVAEHAWGLLLAAAKRIARYDASLKSGEWKYSSPVERGLQVMVLKGCKLGILGYGGIGKATAHIAKAFGMEVWAFTRHEGAQQGVRSFRGTRGLRQLLRGCDAFVLSLPLTRHTKGIIGEEQLKIMKDNAVVVNVGRAELVDESALYFHLSVHPSFTYATDVWWVKGGREEYAPKLPFLSLFNFIGTPHVSGPSASVRGKPNAIAIQNLRRFARGEKPLNLVDRKEYA